MKRIAPASLPRGTARIVALFLAAAGIACLVWGWHSHHSTPPPQPSRAETLTRQPDTEAGGRPGPAPLPESEPVRVRIPRTGVDAPLMRLGLDHDRHLDVPPPDDRNLAGWYQDGVTPGDTGTALITGHVDTKTGPAVFYSLGALKKGDTIRVVRKDGRTAVFTVYAVEVFSGTHFPDEKVYGASAHPELRVLTCGGGYDRAHHEYLGNVVVFARMSAIA
ncbi:class F sortase [Streptomyces sp. NRRL S-337]|uniref:class F sortase n=1 Tax=Streptomyces sp. NRRL S-337 TaxID=1463900 RepID=UPI00068A917B|nr:class F sortase [Streptomyces sp. NRRL S-337]